MVSLKSIGNLYSGGGLNAFNSLFGGGGDQSKAMKRLFDQMQRSNALRFTQAEGHQLQGLDQLRSGYDEAIQNVGRTGLASKMNIEAAGKQARSSTAQRLTNAGLSGTTVGAQLPGAYQGQTAAALAGVDQAVAAAKGGLLTSRGSALNSAYGGLSQLAQNRNSAEMRLGGLAFEQMANQPSDMDGFLQLMQGLGPLLGLMGGPGLAIGAGASAMGGQQRGMSWG